ncbi:SMI1/KNR4 family protein [Bacillus gobiensis]
MDYLKIKSFFEEHEQFSILTGGISDHKIKEIEFTLSLQLPESYKWFLRNYGSGGAFGTMILGYDEEGAEVIDRTEMYRKYYGLTNGIVVIEYIDEFSYCLDTNKMRDGECPVILWANQGGHGRTVAINFLEFLAERL